MATGRMTTLVLVGALASLGASYRVQSTNFLVEAESPQVAQQVAQYAEHYRKEKAVQWLGREMPPWRAPCPLRVKVTMDGAGGATTFEYGNGEVLHQHMTIEGSYDRLLASVLPHEITHTVFAHYYRCPVPRWADEGGSVLSEDDVERNRHDQLTRQILSTPGRAMPLRRLFSLKEYPSDVMVLYAQGYSVTNYLVTAGGRPTFLRFLAQGMRQGWDAAVQSHYGYRNIEDLERAWVDSVRNRRPPELLARNTAGPAPADPARRVVVRQTAPPVLLTFGDPQPTFRAQAPDNEADAPAGPDGYPVRRGAPAHVTLGAPQYEAPAARLGTPTPR